MDSNIKVILSDSQLLVYNQSYTPPLTYRKRNNKKKEKRKWKLIPENSCGERRAEEDNKLFERDGKRRRKKE